MNFRHAPSLAAAVLALTALPAVAQAPAPAVPPAPARLTVPAGFTASVFASGLQGARLMAVSPEGVLVVAKRAEVVALPDANHDGVAEPRVLLRDMPYAHSLAFHDGYLYIGTTPAVVRVKWERGDVVGTPEPYVTLPSSTPAMHTSRTIAFGPDGRLYVGIGSSCNVCVEGDARRTTIQVFDGPGSPGRTFAAGLHNPVGFDWDPATGRLWSADTGQEKLGDDYPPDEINLIEDGRHYGFPFFIGRNVASTVPELDGVPRTLQASAAVPPAFELPAHASPLGLAFYRGTAFPEPYRSSMYVAIHGSTQRPGGKIGYSVVRVSMKDGRPAASEDFATGWLDGENVSGRPAGLVTGADGALYVSDDNKGFIYRIAAAAGAAGQKPPDAVAREVFSRALPPLGGAALSARLSEVTYPPGGVSSPHRHPCPVVGYVLEGAIRFAVNGESARVVEAGETFFETLGDEHTVSANASATAPARFLAFLVCDTKAQK
ncbi:MAG: PQQ-dependent sugar dehydrogenase [Vicinamibacterales bacterium]